MRYFMILVATAACSFHPNYGGNGEFECGAGGICPAGQTCASDNHCYTTGETHPDGAIGPDGNVLDGGTATYTVGGTINGLAGSGLQFQLNNSETITIDRAATSYKFTTELADGAAVSLRVATQPQHLSQICTLGTVPTMVSGANVSVAVTCSTNSFAVGGVVNGLTAAGLQVTDGSTLQTLLATATSYSFLELDGTMFDLEIKAQPAGETCVVNNNKGTLDGASVNNATISCGTTTYAIGGTLSGLTSSGLMLSDGVDTVSPLAGDATFTFPTQLPDGAGYKIVVANEPAGESCSVSNGSGNVMGAAVSVQVVCSSATYNISGTVTGYLGSGLVLEQGGDRATVDSTDPNFTFSKVIAGSTFDVTVQTDPEGPPQHCTVTNGSGTMPAMDVTNVVVSCANRVTARYSNGPDWNDFIVDDGTDQTNASNTPCDPNHQVSGGDCLPGSNIRDLVVSGVNSCTGITATDALGVFSWVCDGSKQPVEVVSTGFTKQSVGLTDLVDFTVGAFKPNAVTVLNGANPVLTSASTIWWKNPVSILTTAQRLTTPSEVYLVASDLTGNITLAGDKEALVGSPSAWIVGTTTLAASAKFQWIEGFYDGGGSTIPVALELDSTTSRLRNVTASDASTALQITGPFSFGSGLTATGAMVDFSLDQASGANLVNLTALGPESFLAVKSANLNVTTLTGVGLTKLDTVSTSTFAGISTAGMLLQSSLTNTIKNTKLTGPITLSASSGNVFQNPEVAIAPSTAPSISLVMSPNNSFYGAGVSGGGGIEIQNGSNNTLIATASVTNVLNAGIDIGGSKKVTIVDSIVANASGDGIHCATSSDLILSAVTVANVVSRGIETDCANTLLANTAVFHSGREGYYLDAMSDNSLIDAAASSNNLVGFFIDSDNLTVLGKIKVGGNTSGKDCTIQGTGDGFQDAMCTTAGGLTTTGVTMATSFTGGLTVDDPTNGVDNQGAAPWTSILTPDDWTLFDFAKRGWGADAAAPVGSQGPCASGGNCRIWDWAVSPTDMTLYKALIKILDGKSANTVTFTFSDGTTVTFLKNAREEMDDSLGNDDGLCETGETCIFEPNIGAYQGHGMKNSAGAFVDGVVTGVTLLQFQMNGR